MIEILTLTDSLKRVVVTVLVGIILALPCVPAAVHALTHSIGPEATGVHVHSGDIHRHEHDSEHHEIFVGDEIPAAVIRKSNASILGYTGVGVFKASLFDRSASSLSSNQCYPVCSDRPELQCTVPPLHYYFANAPPA